MMRMEVISSNMANLNATRTPEGGPYRRRDVIFRAVPMTENFGSELTKQIDNLQVGVEVERVFEDQSPFLKKYEPNHPDAGPDGFVLYPNINVVAEMVNLQEASRSYEANLSVVLAVKNMIAKTFEIGR
jgi:flagellar basal-body rod protein FlgC